MAGKRIHLYGIDAPEISQECRRRGGKAFPFGRFAASFLQELLQTQPLTCQEVARNELGGLLAKCFVLDGSQLNAVLVSGGLAYAHPDPAHECASVESEAKRNRVGLWAMECVPPWKWRQGIREQLDQAEALFRDMGMDWWTAQAQGLRGADRQRGGVRVVRAVRGWASSN